MLYLKQLRAAIESDLNDFSDFYAQLTNSGKDLLTLIESLQSGRFSSDTIDRNLVQVATWRSTAIRTGPYEEVKNRGYSLISSPTLRSALIDLYERKWPNLSGTSQADVDYSTNRIAPYFLENIARSIDGSYKPAVSYEELQQSVLFNNLVVGKLNRLRRWFIPAADDYRQAAQTALLKIESEITRLEQ